MNKPFTNEIVTTAFYLRKIRDISKATGKTESELTVQAVSLLELLYGIIPSKEGSVQEMPLVEPDVEWAEKIQ